MKKNTVSILSFLCVATICVGFSGCAVNKDNADITVPNETSDTSPLSVDATQTAPTTLDEENSEWIQSPDTASNEVSQDTTRDEDSISFKLDVGDDKHYFTISMRAVPICDNDSEFYDRDLNITVSDVTNAGTTYQVIKDYTFGTLFQDYIVEDVNFDGFSDFYYVASRGNANIYYSFWVCSTKTETFISADELADISLSSFDSEAKVIQGFCRSSAASNMQTFYKYIEEILTCVRILDMGYPDENSKQQLTVQDYVDGKLVEVFNKKTILSNEFSGEIYNEFFKWEDLNYHGTT